MPDDILPELNNVGPSEVLECYLKLLPLLIRPLRREIVQVGVRTGAL